MWLYASKDNTETSSSQYYVSVRIEKRKKEILPLSIKNVAKNISKITVLFLRSKVVL